MHGQERGTGKTWFLPVLLVFTLLAGCHRRELRRSGPQWVPNAAPAATSKAAAGAPDSQLLRAGAKLFREQPCLSCHRFNGQGGHSGPDLTHEARRHAARQPSERP